MKKREIAKKPFGKSGAEEKQERRLGLLVTLKRGQQREIIELLVQRGLLPSSARNTKRLSEKIRRLAKQQKRLAEKIELINRELLAPFRPYGPASRSLGRASALALRAFAELVDAPDQIHSDAIFSKIKAGVISPGLRERLRVIDSLPARDRFDTRDEMLRAMKKKLDPENLTAFPLSKPRSRPHKRDADSAS